MAPGWDHMGAMQWHPCEKKGRHCMAPGIINLGAEEMPGGAIGDQSGDECPRQYGFNGAGGVGGTQIGAQPAWIEQIDEHAGRREFASSVGDEFINGSLRNRVGNQFWLIFDS
jgi:hypothetical protein